MSPVISLFSFSLGWSCDHPWCLWLVPSSALLAPITLCLAVALRAPDLGALGAVCYLPCCNQPFTVS